MIFKKHHRWPALLTKKKKISDVIYSFCGRLVPYWIMKVAREEFCLLRSIGRFHCHNTRCRSETGVWQMVCHLCQHDVLCVCLCMCSLHDFYSLRETECEKQSEIHQCVYAMHSSVYVRQKTRRAAEWKNMNTCTQRNMLESVWYTFILPPKKPLVLAVLQHTLTPPLI